MQRTVFYILMTVVPIMNRGALLAALIGGNDLAAKYYRIRLGENPVDV